MPISASDRDALSSPVSNRGCVRSAARMRAEVVGLNFGVEGVFVHIIAYDTVS